MSQVRSRRCAGDAASVVSSTSAMRRVVDVAARRRPTTRPSSFTTPTPAASTPASQYSDRLHEAGIAAPIGSVGDGYDNAMAEALNGTYKAEVIRPRGQWRTRNQAEFATIEWIDWYYTTCLHSQIGHIAPLEHEAQWHAAHDPANVAITNQT